MDTKYIHVIPADTEFFCINDFEPKSKEMYYLYFKTEQRQKNEVAHYLMFVMNINLAVIIIIHTNNF